MLRRARAAIFCRFSRISGSKRSILFQISRIALPRGPDRCQLTQHAYRPSRCCRVRVFMGSVADV